MNIPFPRRGIRGEPQLLPLINVVFLLLIFFMLAGAIDTHPAFELKALRAQADQQRQDHSYTLALASDGRLALNGEELPPERIRELLAAWLAAHPQAELSLRADAGVDTLELIRLMEWLRELGARRLQLLALPAAHG